MCVHFRSLFVPYFFTAVKTYPCYYTYLKPIASSCYLFIPQNAFTCQGLLIHPPNDGYLGGLQFSADANNTHTCSPMDLNLGCSEA